MNNELLTSRFFTTDDKRMDKVIFPLPPHWWSRPFEYAWAAEFCEETDGVLDAACGIAHPFKFYLAEHCKEIYAIDKDPDIVNHEAMSTAIDYVFGENAHMNVTKYPKSVFVKQADITAIPYPDGTFDKVFGISILEHLPDEDKLKALKEFRRTLKDGGMVILTLDYSTSPEYSNVTMDAFEAMANEAGLKLAGEKNAAIPPNAINWNHNLFCFRMALVKDKDDEGNPLAEPEKEVKKSSVKAKSKANAKSSKVGSEQ